jgi:predicted nucleic acid-binding protein
VILLDTNVISELRKVRLGRTDPTFVAWASGLQWSDLYLSVITIYELQLGIASLDRYDHAQSIHLRAWLEDKVLSRFDSRILPVTTAIATRSAYLEASRTRGVEDALIASTAYLHGMSVATRNVNDFEDTGIKVINPWATPAGS